MKEDKKIFCLQCKFHTISKIQEHICKNKPHEGISPLGKYISRYFCEHKNKNNDCEEFQPKEKESSIGHWLSLFYALTITAIIVIIILKLLNYGKIQ